MTRPDWESPDKSCRVFIGDMRHILPLLPDNHYHACVTDPPYHLTTGKKGGTGPASVNSNSPAGRARISTGFMGKAWDGGDVAFDPVTWTHVLKALRPGAHLLAFGGSRTFHRLACAIEDAGFEIRDTIMWIYGSGFPKSLDVSKAIDKAAGVVRDDKFEGAFSRNCGPTGNKRCESCGKWLVSGSPCQCPRPQDEPTTDAAKQWQGWGTALKPAYEPIIVARKPLTGTVAENVLEHGTGALNIDRCRIDANGDKLDGGRISTTTDGWDRPWKHDKQAIEECKARGAQAVAKAEQLGRWPANVIHDGSHEVLERFPTTTSGKEPPTGFRRNKPDDDKGIYGAGKGLWCEEGPAGSLYGDSGSVARFFYAAKATKSERPTYVDQHGKTHTHPTVKPLALMEYLCKLVTPPRGTILDPFAGSGATVEAAFQGHWNCDAIDLESLHLPLIASRIDKRCHNERVFHANQGNALRKD